MNPFDWIAIGVGSLSSLWLACALTRIIRNVRAFRLLRDQAPPEPAAWPRLSVIITACNEAATLSDAIRTLLGQEYPNLEIFLVDDRSTDGTGAIVDELARGDKRIIPLHIERLPEGWLGKTHAMYQAQQRATGEWLLFIDADVHLAPGIFRRTIAFCLAEKRDHLTIVPDSPRIPRIRLSILSAITAYLYQLFWLVPVRTIERNGRNPFFGLGAFNLVRASALGESRGLEWLRMEVSDDFGIALLVHEAGHRSGVLGGKGVVSIVWWPDIRAMLASKDKDISDYGFSFLRIFGWAAFLPVVVFTPLGLAAYGGAPIPLFLYLTTILVGIWITRRTGYSPLVPLLFPIAVAVLCMNLVHAGWSAWKRGGLVWRGTVYPLDKLRELQRVRYK